MKFKSISKMKIILTYDYLNYDSLNYLNYLKDININIKKMLVL